MDYIIALTIKFKAHAEISFNEIIKIMQSQKFRDFVSGLIAGFISVTVCNPLDIARTRLNIMSSPSHSGDKYNGLSHAIEVIYKQEGFKGFYAGYKVNAKAIPIFHSIFFPIYESSKKFCRNNKFPKWKEYIFSTFVAGSLCNFLTNPIWVVRTRVMVQALHHTDFHYQNTNSIIRIMTQMVKEEGVGSLFKGLSASMMGISNAIIYFFIYQSIKDYIRKDINQVFNSYYVFAASLFAKFMASSITYPLIVVRTIMQDHRTNQKMGFFKVCNFIYHERGLHGFYGGLKPDLLRLLPSNTIVFLVYEYLKRKWPIQPKS